MLLQISFQQPEELLLKVFPPVSYFQNIELFPPLVSSPEQAVFRKNVKDVVCLVTFCSECLSQKTLLKFEFLSVVLGYRLIMVDFYFVLTYLVTDLIPNMLDFSIVLYLITVQT